MIRIISILAILIATLSMSANAAKITSGNLDSLKKVSKIAVTLDCGECVFLNKGKKLSFEHFLAFAERENGWVGKSLKYFVKNFNEKTFGDGLIVLRK